MAHFTLGIESDGYANQGILFHYTARQSWDDISAAACSNATEYVPWSSSFNPLSSYNLYSLGEAYQERRSQILMVDSEKAKSVQINPGRLLWSGRALD